MDDITFPKVLIVGECFRASGGPGITLESLFWRWPSYRIADVGYRLERSNRITYNHYYLSDMEFRWLWQRHSRMRTSKCQHTLLKNTNSSEKKQKEGKNGYSLKRRFSNRMIPSFYFKRGIVSNKLKNWLNKFSPDVIYAQPSLTSLSFIRAIYEYLRLPLIIHNMDDWQSQINTNGALFGFYARTWARKQLKYLINESSARLGICEEMAIAYQKRYKLEFGHYQYLINYHKGNITPASVKLCRPVKILYAGRIGTGICSSLRMIARAVEELKDSYDISFTIRTFTIDLAQRYGLDKYLDGIGYLSQSELRVYLEGFDILCIPIDFDEASIRYIKLSMPTKVPEYMASGVPILVFGSTETALVKYALRDQWAEVVSDNSVETLKASINKLVTDERYRLILAKKALEIASRNHSRKNNLNNFRDIIRAAAATRN